jgi:hypothetical protein
MQIQMMKPQSLFVRDLIAVAFSLKQDGDVELVFRSQEWRAFLVHLQRALALAEAPDAQ